MLALARWLRDNSRHEWGGCAMRRAVRATRLAGMAATNLLFALGLLALNLSPTVAQKRSIPRIVCPIPQQVCPAGKCSVHDQCYDPFNYQCMNIGLVCRIGWEACGCVCYDPFSSSCNNGRVHRKKWSFEGETWELIHVCRLSITHPSPRRILLRASRSSDDL